MEEVDVEELDPRVQIQLERLNASTDEINRLEVELDEANALFRTTLTESSQRLKQIKKKMTKSVEAARPYYEAQDRLLKAQLECQKAAVQFQRASEIHQAATETIMLAEQRFLAKQSEWQFDNAWQEMLNHATMKVTEAKRTKLQSEYEHRMKANVFKAAEQELHLLREKLKRDIKKSCIYFETKAAFERTLDDIKGRIEVKRKAVQRSKEEYNSALRSLELISTEIHQRRQSSSAASAFDRRFVPITSTPTASMTDLSQLLEETSESMVSLDGSGRSSMGAYSSSINSIPSSSCVNSSEEPMPSSEFVEIDLNS